MASRVQQALSRFSCDECFFPWTRMTRGALAARSVAATCTPKAGSALRRFETMEPLATDSVAGCDEVKKDSAEPPSAVKSVKELFGSGDNPSSDLPADVTYFLIVRHGETLWNADGRTQGQLDIGLNDAGRRQAHQLGESLHKLGVAQHVDTIVSSDLSRASETGDVIAQYCAQARRVKPDVNPEMSKGLREMNFGKLQGLLHPETRDEKKRVYDNWTKGEFAVCFPGEGADNATSAIARGLNSLRDAAELGSFVVVVAHGGLIKWLAVACEHGQEPPSPKSMSTPEISTLLNGKIGNCYCSALLWDRTAGRPVQGSGRWFHQINAADSKEDTG